MGADHRDLLPASQTPSQSSTPLCNHHRTNRRALDACGVKLLQHTEGTRWCALHLEAGEALLAGGARGDDAQHVEPHGLGEGAALADDDGVTLVDAEARGDVGRDVAVALLVPLVLGDVVQVVPPQDDGAGHLGGLDLADQDAAADGHVAGEGALVVNVVACGACG